MQTDRLLRASCTAQANPVPGIPIVGNVTIDGITFTIHHRGSYTAYDMPTTMTSGTINVGAIIQDAISRGYVASTSVLNSIQYGVEVCDNGGVNTRFDVHDFSITTR